MKRSIAFLNYSLMVLALCFFSTTASAVNSGKTPTKLDLNALNSLNAADFLEMTSQDFQALTGKKMKWHDKIVLKLAQHDVRKALKKNEEVNVAEAYDYARSDFNIGAFLLGLFLGPIGVLIAWIFIDGGLRSSLIGLLAAFLIGAIGIFSFR